MRSLWMLCLAGTLEAQVAPLTLVAPAAPGGGWDQLARSMARVLESEGLAGPVQVENIPGAAGTVGLARFVSGRRGDGSALLVTGLVMVGGVVQNRSPVSLRDVTAISRLVGEYEVIAVPAGSPFKTLGDLVAALRADPGSVAWGGGSAGGTDQILVDLVARAAGVDPARTSYVAFSGGGEARTALLGAQVQAGVSGIGEFAELARSGSVRLLAVSSAQRLPGWDVPTLREAGVDVVLANWRGVVAPPGLHAAERARLLAMMERLVASPAWRDEADRKGWEQLPLAGEGFARFAESEMRRVEELVTLKRGGRVVAPPTSRAAWWLLGGLLLALGAGLRRGGDGGRPRGRWRGVLWIVGGIAANIAMAEWLGFVAGASLLFGATAVAFGERRPVRVAVTALAFSLATFAVFRGGLDVALPAGSLWQGVGR